MNGKDKPYRATANVSATAARGAMTWVARLFMSALTAPLDATAPVAEAVADAARAFPLVVTFDAAATAEVWAAATVGTAETEAALTETVATGSEADSEAKPEDAGTDAESEPDALTDEFEPAAADEPARAPIPHGMAEPSG